MAKAGGVLPFAVMVSMLLFPLARLLWCRRVAKPHKSFSRGDAAGMVLAGAGAPQALCLVLWPLWPDMLKAVTDIPLLLLPTGAIALIISIGAIFDWK